MKIKESGKSGRPSSRGVSAEALAFEDRAIATLKDRGFRITMPRVQVIRAMGETNSALSAYGVHERILELGGRIDVVSVYRILNTLMEAGLIHHIGIVDGYLACRMKGGHGHQMEHAVCKSCGSVAELGVSQEAISATQAQLKELGFVPENIKVEIVGNCKNCATPN